MPNVVPFPTICTRTALQVNVDDLAAALANLPELAGNAYQVEHGQMNEIAIARNGHVLGVWRIVDGLYLYASTGNRQAALKCRDLSHVLRETRKLLAGSLANKCCSRERRRNQRWPVRWVAVLHANGEAQVSIIRDLSAGGLRAVCSKDLSLGDSLVLEVLSRIRLTGSVVWLKPSEFGFTHHDPLQPGHPLLTAAQRCCHQAS